MKTVLIIAGGTGGHIFPALTIADHLKQQGIAVYWMGAEVGMEKNLVGNQYPLYLLPVKGMRGKSVLEQLKTPFRIIKSVILAYQHIKKIKPDVILGMGGYASGPGGIAAKLLGIPLVIHEQNAFPGLTNKVLSRVATTVLQAFPNTFSKKAMTVGNPVRTAIQKITRPDDYYQTRGKPWKILILGGSQGAHFINQLMMDFLKENHTDDFLVWHQTGRKEFDVVNTAYAASTNNVYRVSPFIDSMDEAYAWADMIIARSGALTVAEVTMVGLPAIFIPFPLAVDDHQYHNAFFIEKNQGAKIFRESELTAEKLRICLQESFFSAEKLQKMSSHAKTCAAREAVADILQYI
ncbi:MAG: undecaprenyldiphospho-muramoylpentapeptide beta-N-acetylglucosaminyltransferase [Coxiellaceae bacterium]|nr:undecaprenyldiphospho-muramoylpentapeptide beta-N-acetylglucosaminyltransferase [Coxiellaceae bacterium]